MLLPKILLSTAGGTVLTALFLMSHGPLRDFLRIHESVSLVHLCFGLVFLAALFWAGFFITWIVYSVTLWSTETLSYSIRCRLKERRDRLTEDPPDKTGGRDRSKL